MNAPASSTADLPLLFDWELPQSRRKALITFLGASVILHAFCFYLFQIVYAPAVVLLPPPARVTLIPANSEEGRSLLRWVDAEDPALASATQRSPEGRQRPLPRVQHIPSYVAEEPKLKQAPPLIPDTRAPSSLPPGPVPMSHRQPPPAVGSIATRISYSEELSNLGPAARPVPHFSASNNESAQAIRFRIGVSPQGEVRYCFLLETSGDSALDEQVRQNLLLGRFSQKSAGASDGDQPLVWGIATVEWGNDIARPAPRPSSTPAQ
jgi:hypothetical protein